MKRLLALALVLVAAVSFTACGGSSDDTAVESTTVETTTVA